MEKEIMDLVNKRRKELGLLIRKKKMPMAEGYFIVREAGRLSEIRVPGVEEYFTDPSGNLKAALPGYLREKWKLYSGKNKSMKLEVVMVISDAWFALDDGSNLPPSQHPKRMEALSFFIHYESEKCQVTFPYERKGKHIVFLEPMVDLKVVDDPSTRFNNLFPNI